jgi:hypothetical protein
MIDRVDWLAPIIGAFLDAPEPGAPGHARAKCTRTRPSQAYPRLLATRVGVDTGPSSTAFRLAAVFAAVVMYDAAGTFQSRTVWTALASPPSHFECVSRVGRRRSGSSERCGIQITNVCQWPEPARADWSVAR